MVRGILFPSLVVALLFGVTGCTAYHRKPIADRQVLHDLQTIRLEGLGTVAGVGESTAPKVNASEGRERYANPIL